MKGGRKKRGIVYRPMEYILWFVLVGVIGMFLYFAYTINSKYTSTTSNNSEDGLKLTGRLEDLDKLTEKEEATESGQDATYEQADQNAATADAAADGYSAVLDEVVGLDFCGRESKYREAIDIAFNRHEAIYEEALREQYANLESRRTKLDDLIVNTRTKQDFRREEAYGLIDQRQTTPEEFDRFKQYKLSVEGAVYTRRGVYDTSRAKYRSEIDLLLENRDKSARNAVKSFQTSIDRAIGDASGLCDEAAYDSVSVSQQLVTKLIGARTSFADKLRGRSDFAGSVRAAADERSLVTNEAKNVFQNTMQAVRLKFANLR